MVTVRELSLRSQNAWNAFRARIVELGGEVIEPSWLGNNKPHRVRCAKGHECAPRPGSVQGGQGICVICVGHGSQKAEADFRRQLSELGATLLEPRWLGIHKPHRVRCAAGHECTPRPTGLRRGQGVCRTCAGNDPQASWAAFRARVEELGGTLLEPTWLGTHEPHQVRCRQGHNCKPRPNRVLRGGGICRTCAGKTWDIFYVVADDSNRLVKFGITSGDPRPRLSRHAYDGFDRIVRLVKDLPDDVAPRLERAILAALRDAREAPARGREYFPARVLGLVLDLVDGWTSTYTEAG